MTDEEITAAANAVTGSPAADPDRLNDIATDIRRVIALGIEDRTSIYYKREDLLAAAELNIKTTLLRANVEEVPVTPQTLADAAHDRAFSFRALNTGLADLIDTRLETLAEQNTEAGLAGMAAALRAQLGAADYDKLIAETMAGLRPGEAIPNAAKGDLTILRLLAAHGRYATAYENTRPKF